MRRSVMFLTATAVTAATVASAQVRTLNPRDVAEAQQQHAALVEEFGGSETGTRGAYVESVGRRVAAYSGVANPAATYRFTVLNSAVENAFAVPGGYVYITRQLMAFMNDEAELGFALGHEVGHIAANHAQARRSAQSRNSVLGVLGSVLGGVLGGSVFGDLISQGAQQAAAMRTLGFSRDQEYQADTLALRYLISSGYDPAGGPGILAALGRASALEARLQGRDNRQTPEWASTHPLSENRSRRALAEAQATGRLGTGIRNRDQFLAQLDGAIVDDDPAQGIIDGRYFTHPDLRIQFAVPVGFLMQNSTREVSIKGSSGQAKFSGGRYTGTLESYAYRALQELAGGRQQIAVPPPQRTTINGMAAAFATTRARTNSGYVDVSVVAYQWDRDTVYHFLMLTRGGAGVAPFAQMINSLRRITPTEASAIQPRIIDVATVRANDSVQTLASRMAYRDFKLERFLSLNGLAANSRLVPGQKVKLVVYGRRRS